MRTDREAMELGSLRDTPPHLWLGEGCGLGPNPFLSPSRWNPKPSTPAFKKQQERETQLLLVGGLCAPSFMEGQVH